MEAIINKGFDILTKQARKIPRAMITIFIIAAIFPNETIEVKNILISKLGFLFPKSFTTIFSKVQFSHEELLFLWFFLLVTFAITLLLDFISQILLEHTIILLSTGSEFLLGINSIFLLGILIYNTLYNPGIELSLIFFSSPIYKYVVEISGAIFAFFFCLTYCGDFIRLYQKMNNSCVSIKKKIALYIIYWIPVSIIVSKIAKIFFR